MTHTFTVNSFLVSELGKNLGGSDESITAFTNTDVEDEFLNVKLAHHISFFGCFGRGGIGLEEMSEVQEQGAVPFSGSRDNPTVDEGARQTPKKTSQFFFG